MVMALLNNYINVKLEIVLDRTLAPFYKHDVINSVKPSRPVGFVRKLKQNT